MQADEQIDEMKNRLNMLTGALSNMNSLSSFLQSSEKSEEATDSSEQTKRSLQDESSDKFTELTSGFTDKLQSMTSENQEDGGKPALINKLMEMANNRRN